MHSVARLVLNGLINNIQASWVKLGHNGVEACLNAGVNDVGGTLMNETITRAAGATHGQETSPQQMDALIRTMQREPRQRTTLYQAVPEEREQTARAAGALLDVVNTPAQKYERAGGRKTLVKNATDDLIASA